MRKDIRESASPPSDPRSWPLLRGTLKRPLALFGFLGVSLILLFVGVIVYERGAPERARRQRMDTTRKFAEIAIAFKSYSDTVALQVLIRSHPPDPDGGWSPNGVRGTGPLPPPVIRAGAAWSDDLSMQRNEGKSSYSYSWRYALFPNLIGVGKLLHYDEPWDAPVNQAVVNKYGSFFYSGPEAARNGPIRDAIALAITGPGTAFGDGREAPMRLSDVPAAAILVVEVRASGIPWPAPGDFDIRTMPQTINAPDGNGISGNHAGGFHVIFGDREVWFLADDVPFETLKKFFTVADAKRYDREKLLGPYALDRCRME
jgi:hypothetical protein